MDVIYDFDPNNLPPEYLQAIGLVTACSAQTENAVQTLIGACLGVDEEYRIAVTAHMPLPLLDSVARAVAEIRLDSLDALDELDSLLDAVKTKMDGRNAFVHQAWAIHPETNAVHLVRQTARGSVQVELRPVSVEEIKASAIAVYEAGLDLVRFMILNGLEPTFAANRPRAHKTKSARKARRAGPRK